MQLFPYHVFVCEQRKPDGLPCCSARDSAAIIEALRREAAAHGLHDKVMVTGCGSLGLCERGPNMVVYPEGVWYSGVRLEDVAEIVTSHFEQGVPVRRLLNTDPAAVKNEIGINRSRFLQSLRTREQAGMLPDDLNQTIRGFQESRVILTAIELDAFTAVGKGATAAQAAATMGSNPDATARLLNALVSLNLLELREGEYRTTAVADRHFVAGAPFDARGALGHVANLWQSWSGLTGAVRTGASAAAAETGGRDAAWTGSFIAAMHRNALERAPHVVATLAPAGARRLLDVGGGSGAWSIAFAQAVPELQADLLDQASVLPIAQRHIDAAGLTDRIHMRPGDLRHDSLGTGYDLVFVSAICHMLSPEENRDLLRRCRAATAPGGRIVIQDFLLDPDRTAPRFAALFSLNMLLASPAGDTYTEAEYAQWLREAGYADPKRLRQPGPAHLMVAHVA
jgi:(2Fe-2S) ferredoxin/predicted O-methyltransferase YrrM